MTEHRYINTRQELYYLILTGHDIEYRQVHQSAWSTLDPTQFTVAELLQFKTLGLWGNYEQTEFRVGNNGQ